MIRLTIMLTLVALAASPAANAESIWARRDESSAFLYRDNVALDIGDSLTMFITDSSSFQFSGSRDMDKASTLSATASLKTTEPASGEDSHLFDPYTAEEQSSRDFQGSSAYTGKRTFSDSMTVTVVDRLPNGNMVVSGRSTRDIDGEDTVTIITGIVRPVDVSGGNTVSSQRVAQLDVYYETDGPSRAFLDQGWLGRLGNVIWPF